MNNITLQPEATLTNLAVGFTVKGLIASDVLTKVESETLTGYFGRVDSNALRIVPTVKLGAGSKNIISVKWDRNTQYEVQDHTLENEINAVDAERFGGWDPAKRKVNTQLSFGLLLAEEYALASTLTSASIITNGTALVGGDQWNNSNSEVLSKVKTAKDRVVGATGMPANTIIMGYDVFSALQFHPEIYDVLGFKYKGPTPPGLLSAEQMAAAFGVDRVLVGSAVYNTAKEGQTASMSMVWGKNFIVAYIAPSDMAEIDPGLGAKILCPSKAPETYVGSYVPEGNEATQVQRLKQGRNYAYQVTNATAAYLIRTAVA